MYQLGDEAGDADTLAEADRTLGELEKRGQKLELQSLLDGKNDSRRTASSRFTPAPAAPRPRTGQRCCCGCTFISSKVAAGTSARWTGPGGTGRDQGCGSAGEGGIRLRLPKSRGRRAPAGSAQPVQRPRQAANQLRFSRRGTRFRGRRGRRGSPRKRHGDRCLRPGVGARAGRM